MNLPNKLTVSRFFLALLLLVFLELDFPYAKTLALLTFLAAALTDALDGHLARTKYGVTTFGKLMDPLADKIIVAAALVGLVGLTWVPAWMVVLILSRELMVTGLRLVAAGQGKILAANNWGKLKTIWQMFAILLILGLLASHTDFGGWPSAGILRTVSLWLIGIATIITVVSGGIYFYDNHQIVLEDT